MASIVGKLTHGLISPSTPTSSYPTIHDILKNDQITYFHSHTATVKELEAASKFENIIFEIDLAWASNPFIANRNIRINTPYIGHPEKFYTELNKPFPHDNVSLNEFKAFLKNHPSIKVLIDLKDKAAFTYLEEFIKEIGCQRCIVHAFIKDWTLLPHGENPDPHWEQEDIDLTSLNGLLAQLNVPLIANCRGFSDAYVHEQKLIDRITQDAKNHQSIVCIGLYYPKAPLPSIDFLRSINAAGYHAWINANDPQFSEKASTLRYIGMKDTL